MSPFDRKMRKSKKLPKYIDLSTPHIISKRKGGTLTTLARKRLADFLGQSEPPEGMDLCHACNVDTHHGDCINPRHAYWCSRSENMKDLADESNPRGRKFRKKMSKIATDWQNP